MPRTYEIEVKTNDYHKAGTDAKVYIELIGAHETTGQIRINTAA